MGSIPELHGFCEDICEPIREAFIQNFADGLEVGASIALVHRGKFLMDLCAGYADKAEQKPWQEDTLACVFSTRYGKQTTE